MKTQTVKISRPARVFSGVVIVTLIVALLLTTDTGARFLSKAIRNLTDAIVQPERIKEVARFIVPIAAGVFLITSGIAALAIPALGAVLIIAGLLLVGASLIQLFKQKPGVDDGPTVK